MQDTRYSDKYRPEVLHVFIEDHLNQRQLMNSQEALELMRSLTIGDPVKEDMAQHRLMMCRMLIDLNMNLTAEEEDVLLAAAICCILPEVTEGKDLDELLPVTNHIHRNVVDIVKLLNEIKTLPAEAHPEYFDRVKMNKLAVLIAIADRGNVAARLHDMNSWQVRHYIYDTHCYYFPLCIYAKQHYHELLSPIGILLEKLRNLIDLSEILLKKYELMEDELMSEIDALKEENGTIKGILQQLEGCD
ncbi:MAG: hypothetical protein HUJ75_02825 [Parasporobacterium sp.]|nr:hypothetical protein [Parasporobacterium sp.]